MAKTNISENITSYEATDSLYKKPYDYYDTVDAVEGFISSYENVFGKTTQAWRVEDDTQIVFSDGMIVTGKELQGYMRVLKKLVETDYPEELL